MSDERKSDDAGGCGFTILVWTLAIIGILATNREIRRCEANVLRIHTHSDTLAHLLVCGDRYITRKP